MAAFAERGFRGTSFNEIAKAAVLTMAGLIYHFPSKVDLFAAVLAARDADDETRLRSMLGDEPTGFQVLDAFVAWARINANRYSFVHLSHLIAAESAPGDHPGTEYARQHFRSTRELVEQALRRSIDAGEIDPEIRPDLHRREGVSRESVNICRRHVGYHFALGRAAVAGRRHGQPPGSRSGVPVRRRAPRLRRGLSGTRGGAATARRADGDRPGRDGQHRVGAA